MSIVILPREEQFAEGFHACLDEVAREKKYVAFQEAPPLEKTRAFRPSGFTGSWALRKKGSRKGKSRLMGCTRT